MPAEPRAMKALDRRDVKVGSVLMMASIGRRRSFDRRHTKLRSALVMPSFGDMRRFDRR
jgi:hypothetical protein